MERFLAGLLIAGLLAFSLAGCGQIAAQNETVLPDKTADNTKEISLEQAQNLALQDAGLEKADFALVHLDTHAQNPHYDLIFVAADQKYEYEIAVQNGKILEIEKESVYNSDFNEQSRVDCLDFEAAEKAALQVFNLSEGVFTQIELEQDDGRIIYELEFYFEGTKYEVEMDAQSGKVLSSSYGDK